MSQTALASQFPSSPAVQLEDQPGTPAPFAITKGIAWTLAGCAALLFIPLAGVPVWLFCWWQGGKSFYRKGVSGGVKLSGIVKGDCPHCQTEVRMLHCEENAKTCPGCKHRLIYRKGQYLDVTA